MTTIALPAGACDCHVHVVGQQDCHPMVADRHYTPGPASVQDLRAHMARNGLSRVVIVQPSVYGFDNRCMLESLQALQGAGRGIAVVADTASAQELQALAGQGVRGLRVNVESAAVRDPEAIAQALAYWAEKVAALGWHLQVYATLDTIAAAVPYLKGLAVPIVLDHFAMAPDSTSLQDTRLQAVLSLVREGQAYVKLSAPYRLRSADTDAPDAVARLAASYIQANPKRVLWGSDWPHTNREAGKTAHQVSAYRNVVASTLRQGLDDWLPEPALRELVLVKNPEALYGF